MSWATRCRVTTSLSSRPLSERPRASLPSGDLAEARKALREEQAEARAVLSAALQSDDGEAPRRTLDEGARTGLPDDELEAAEACQEVSLEECVTTVQQQLHGRVSHEVSPEEAGTTAPFMAAALPSSPLATTCQEIFNGLPLHLQANREGVMIPASMEVAEPGVAAIFLMAPKLVALGRTGMSSVAAAAVVALDKIHRTEATPAATRQKILDGFVSCVEAKEDTAVIQASVELGVPKLVELDRMSQEFQERYGEKHLVLCCQGRSRGAAQDPGRRQHASSLRGSPREGGRGE